MSKTQIAGIALAAVGLYGLWNGKTGTDTTSIVQTWVPLLAAAYVFFA